MMLAMSEVVPYEREPLPVTPAQRVVAMIFELPPGELVPLEPVVSRCLNADVATRIALLKNGEAELLAQRLEPLVGGIGRLATYAEIAREQKPPVTGSAISDRCMRLRMKLRGGPGEISYLGFGQYAILSLAESALLPGQSAQKKIDLRGAFGDDLSELARILKVPHDDFLAYLLDNGCSIGELSREHGIRDIVRLPFEQIMLSPQVIRTMRAALEKDLPERRREQYRSMQRGAYGRR